MNGQELISQLTSAAIVVYLLEALKRSRWFSWVTAETRAINRILAAGGAAVSAIGVHVAYDATAGSLVITGLTLASLIHGAWHFANSYALQQLVYDGVIKPGQTPPSTLMLTLPSSVPPPHTNSPIITHP